MATLWGSPAIPPKNVVLKILSYKYNYLSLFPCWFNLTLRNPSSEGQENGRFLYCISLYCSVFKAYSFRLAYKSGSISKLEKHLLARVCCQKKKVATFFGGIAGEPLQENLKVKPRNFRLWMIDDEQVNAYALGHREIMVTTGLLSKYQNKPDVIEAILAHEAGHLHYGDAQDRAVSIGLYASIGIVIWLGSIATAISLFFMNRVHHIFFWLALPIIIIFLPLLLFGRTGKAIFGHALSSTGKWQEYRADRFAVKLGLYNKLREFLENLDAVTPTNHSLLNRIQSSHPQPMRRVYHIEQYAKKIKNADRKE